MTVVRVLKPGMLTTIQDFGRVGTLRLGIPPSGALDRFSLEVANYLAGNRPGEACLEVTLLGPTLEFGGSSLVALGGADFEARLNGRQVETWSSFAVQAGDQLILPAARTGCRAYLALEGGIRVPEVLGSRSTFRRGRLGGIQGRALLAGDEIPIGEATGPFNPRRLPSLFRPRYTSLLMARVVLGPQDDYFSAEDLNLFLHSDYRVLPESDRMGYRLSGARLSHSRGPDIISDAVVGGAIQVPGDGNPIVMLADRQTTGGYPKIGTVLASDVDRLAQLRPGDTIRFTAVSLHQAHDLYLNYRKTFAQIRTELGETPVHSEPRTQRFSAE